MGVERDSLRDGAGDPDEPQPDQIQCTRCGADWRWSLVFFAHDDSFVTLEVLWEPGCTHGLDHVLIRRGDTWRPATDWSKE